MGCLLCSQTGEGVNGRVARWLLKVPPVRPCPPTAGAGGGCRARGVRGRPPQGAGHRGGQGRPRGAQQPALRLTPCRARPISVRIPSCAETASGSAPTSARDAPLRGPQVFSRTMLIPIAQSHTSDRRPISEIVRLSFQEVEHELDQLHVARILAVRSLALASALTQPRVHAPLCRVGPAPLCQLRCCVAPKKQSTGSASPQQRMRPHARSRLEITLRSSSTAAPTRTHARTNRPWRGGSPPTSSSWASRPSTPTRG